MESDSSVSLKRRHYGNHRKDLTYGGFLKSADAASDQRLFDAAETTASGDDGRKAERKRQRSEVGRLPGDDDLLLAACGGRTAHKYD